jgi:rubrerythrin
MKNKYSIREIIQFAIEIEKEGKIFYQKMAGQAMDEKIKKIYLQLMQDESDHQETYQKFLDNLGPDHNEYLYHMQNEYIEYLHSFIENIVFDKDKIDQLIESFKTEQAAIDYAIEKEKSSIKYYESLKQIVIDHDNKIVDQIITEEKSHIEKLQNLKKR